MSKKHVCVKSVVGLGDECGSGLETSMRWAGSAAGGGGGGVGGLRGRGGRDTKWGRVGMGTSGRVPRGWATQPVHSSSLLAAGSDRLLIQGQHLNHPDPPLPPFKTTSQIPINQP